MIVVALPTIIERGEAWQEVANVWYETGPNDLLCVPSWRKGGWVAGLEEVWELHGSDAEVFITASDDMRPQEGWYEAVSPWLDKGVIAPQMLNRYPDPAHNWDRFGPEMIEGQEVDMSSFPILCQAIARQVFPFGPEDPQHYYADNIISDKARAKGYPTIAVPSCVIVHDVDQRGRGAGMGDEPTRMAYDQQVYRKATRGA